MWNAVSVAASPVETERDVDLGGPDFRVTMYTDSEARGGAEMVLAHLLSGLPECATVSLIGVDENVVEWLSGHRTTATSSVVAPIRDRKDLAGMWRHRKAFAASRPDIIHFNLHSMSSCQWAMAAAETLREPKCMAVENSPMGTWSATSKRLKKLTSARLAAHIAVGERTARTIETNGELPNGSVRTIYHGIAEVEPGVPMRPSTGPVIGTIARHDPVKGIDVLIDAMADLPDVHLIVVGSGSETDRLVAQRDRLGLADRVHFRDVAWNEKATDHLASFDVFVLPSRLEGFPVTVMEAAMAGLPVVVTDVGSVRESVSHGTTGIVVPPEDPAAMARAVRELLDDPQLRRQMGCAARQRAEERFTIDATVASYMKVYRELLAT